MVVVALSTRIHGYWRFLARLLVNGSAECGGPQETLLLGMRVKR
jgi:hypothetical protein